MRKTKPNSIQGLTSILSQRTGKRGKRGMHTSGPLSLVLRGKGQDEGLEAEKLLPGMKMQNEPTNAARSMQNEPTNAADIKQERGPNPSFVSLRLLRSFGSFQ
jgi:hypothetical protein